MDCVDHVVEVVKRSSVKGLNKTRRYNGREGFQYLDILGALKIYFRKLSGMQKYQHFLFTHSQPGVVKVQEVANAPFQEFKLLKASKEKVPKVVKKIKNLSFPVLIPPPMKYERQEYLYQNIRPFVSENLKM